MNIKQKELCWGCLSGSRLLRKINVYSERQCFLQIINEIMVAPSNMPLLLCWECAALLRKFNDFKQQIKLSYETLCSFPKQNIISNDQKPTRLNVKEVVHMYIGPNDTINEINEIKNEDTKDISDLEDTNIFTDDFESEVKVDLTDDLEPEVKTDCGKDYDSEIKVDVKRKKKTKKKRHKGLQNVKSPKVKNNFINGTSLKEGIKEETDTIKENTHMYTEIELTADELTEERRLETLTEDYINAMFRCEKCIVTFPNEDDLKDHVRIKHELHSSKLKCAVCERTFASEISYNYHAGSHARRYECAVCASKFSSKRSATRHYNTAHCCGPELPSRITEADQNGHADNSIKQELFPCDYCEKTFKWKTSLRKHIETHKIESGQKRKPYCEPCRLSFKTTSNLQKHVRTSSKHQIQLKLRKVQGSQEDVSIRIEQIKRAVTRSKQFYPCALCEKRFQWRGNLARHLHTHATRAKGELVCEPCNRTFSSIATYKQHMKISKKHVTENEYKFMCNDCGKRFANKIRLRDHLEYEHLKIFRHTCPLCQKVFKCHTSLYLHKQIVHKKNNTEHLCDQCGKAFPNGAKLRTHITATHSSVAPHTCGTCSARFRWHSCLSRHMRRVHHNNKQ